MTQATLPMNFSNARPTTAADWLWSRVVYKGTFGTVVEYDADTFAQPMLRVLFDDGRLTGWLKTSELGVR